MTTRAIIRLSGPFDLSLSLRAAAAFLPPADCVSGALRVAILFAGKPTLIEIRQSSTTPSLITASAAASIERCRLTKLTRWLISADLDLRKFYRIADGHRIMAPVVQRLRGLKPFCPASPFEMGLIAITEQQLSLAAAFHIRTQLFRRFGTPIKELWIPPTADLIAKAQLRSLRACGLSRRKAEYVRDFARSFASGDLDLEALKRKTEDEIRDRLIRCRGFGIWSAQYFLLRGLGRYDSLPSDDTGLRRAVGQHLSPRRLLSPAQLERVLAPFSPFRGLAAFYLAIDKRLQLHGTLMR